MDYKLFLSKDKALLEAPAGYGKTTSIVECLKVCEGKQLILTHTHAGVASLKKKIKEAKIDSKKYNIETIDSFALRTYKSHMGKEKQTILEDEDVWKKEGKNIKTNVTHLIKKSSIIRSILRNTYTGVFVDEYQDCTESANALIEEIGSILPVRIFGDWLQAIFGFNKNDPLTEYSNLHPDFIKNKFELTIPWRWEKTNKELGSEIKLIRSDLIANKKTDLSNCKQIEVTSDDSYIKKICFSVLKTNESILIVHPDKNHCRTIAKYLTYKYHVLESIDDKDFYRISKLFDELVTSKSFQDNFFLVIEEIFTKGSIEEYYKSKSFINKKEVIKKIVSTKIQNSIKDIEKDFSFKKIADLLYFLHTICKFSLKDNRVELFNTIYSALIISDKDKILVYKAVRDLRDNIRHTGRVINYHAIDTTLLTKGLEFDNVIVIGGDSIGSKYGKYNMKNWYVAISRGTKRLIIHSSTKVFDFSSI